jgi:riboflavin synthase
LIAVFTGIIEQLGTVAGVTPRGPGRLITIESSWVAADSPVLGDSVAVNGVCLTVVGSVRGSLAFEVGPETLVRTNLGELVAGNRVNLERAMLPTTRLGGHFVQGHVDGVARIAGREREAEWDWVDFAAPTELTDQMVAKGSLAVDGVSLTLVAVRSGSFRVMLIPHTLAHTTLGTRIVGATVNIETDILGKYVIQAVARAMEKP